MQRRRCFTPAGADAKLGVRFNLNMSIRLKKLYIYFVDANL